MEKTHLVKVFYETPDAQLSAEIANTLVQTFIRENMKQRDATDTYAQDFLDGELDKARQQLTDSENRLVAYAQANNILEVNNSQATQEQKLNGLNQALAAAEQRRIEADNQLQQAMQHQSVNGLLNNAVITSLKSQLSALEAEYQNQAQLFKPGYPDMQQLEREIQTVRTRLATELRTLETSLAAEQAAAVSQEDRLRAELQGFRDELSTLRDNSVEYNALQREVETSRKLYDGLLQRRREVSVASGVTTSNMRVVDAAVAPVKPFRPNKPLNLLVGLLSGLMLATGLALLRESLNRSVRSADELQAISGLPVLGTIPYVGRLQRGKLNLAAVRNVGSSVAEAYRIAAANLRFVAAKQPRVILVTSISPGEGKSTSSVNLALSKAQMGNKVLLVDADLRRPSIHSKMELGNQQGLAEYLYGEVEPAKATQAFREIRNAYVMTGGVLNLDPVEALSSARMTRLLEMARRYFDVTIIDAPPVTGFADTLLLAGMVDAVVLVASEETLDRQRLKQVIGQLQRIRNNVAGLLLVKTRELAAADAGYYQRYQRRRAAGTVPLIAPPP
ncbi:MAG: polysaccharide biosynthesis tyrosine autokinase [Thiolinea sp.]